MSSFSRFLKELPFLSKHYRRQESPKESSTPLESDLAGITINVYELEIQDNGNIEQEGVEGVASVCPSPNEEETNEDLARSATTSGLTTIWSHQLRYANVVVYCGKCKTEVPVCTLDYHRRKHQALETMRYSTECSPITVRGLLRRRNKAMNDVMEKPDAEDGYFVKCFQKINVAFEFLKSELEGMSGAEHIVYVPRWREKDIKSEGKILNRKMALGVSKYRKLDHSASASKGVYVDEFVESGKGVFVGIYQGYNGSYVTKLCVRELHKDIQRNLQRIWNIGLRADDIKSVFEEAYQRIDRIQLIAESENLWTRWSGCSAVTCLLVDDTLYVANEGSLRALLIRDNNTIRVVTSCHDLYNRKERIRVRRNQGMVVKTEKCALVNGVLATTRGLGNQGDWGLKVCVINRPRFRVVCLKEGDRMLVLASEGLWKVFNYREIIFLLNKFIHDALTNELRTQKPKQVTTNTNTQEGSGFLGRPLTVKHDSEFNSFTKHVNKHPIDFRLPEKVLWNPTNPQIFIRRATLVEEESLLNDTQMNRTNCLRNHFNEPEEDDEDLQELARIISVESESLNTRREIARLLSKRLLKSALIAGAEMNNVVMVLLLKGFKIERKKINV